MARPRTELHTKLLAITPNVYFQPPEGLAIEYPCIIYKRDAADTKFANNDPYSRMQRYQITVIDSDPDSPLPAQVAQFRLCEYLRFFTTQYLNHDIFIHYH